MAKDKGGRHLHARLSYLQRAAAYLASQQSQQRPDEPKHKSSRLSPSPCRGKQEVEVTTSQLQERMRTTNSKDSVGVEDSQSESVLPQIGGLANHFSSQLRQVAQKSQIRLDTSVKHMSCKICNTVLVEGRTCKRSTENPSRGGRKLHASVLVIECTACGYKKRYPIGAKRQQRKALRSRSSSDGTAGDSARPDT